MNKRHWIFLALIVLIPSFYFQSTDAQDTPVCQQNSPYWQHWHENPELRTSRISSSWNGFQFDVSPDGKLLVVATQNSLTLYDTQTLTSVANLESSHLFRGPNYPGTYHAVQWSPDGSQIAAAYAVLGDPKHPNPANGIQIWDVEQKKELTLLSNGAGPSTIDWSPNSSTLAEADSVGTIRLWDVDKGIASTLYERKGFSSFSTVGGLSWSPDGRYLAAMPNSGGTLRVYTFGSPEPQVFESPDEEIFYVAWSSDSERIVMASRISFKLFMVDVKTGEISQTVNGGENTPLDLQWSPDGRWLARGTRTGFYLWNMSSDNRSPARVFADSMPSFVEMVWTPDSQSLISVDYDGSLYRWNIETGCVEAAYLKDWKPT